MSRDHRKLKVFTLADELVFDVYEASKDFPSEEKYGLRSQIRRASVSVPTNIVEGCLRRTEKDYVNFLGIALGSAGEVRYLASVTRRLGFTSGTNLEERYDELVRGLDALVRSMS
jgi:four helix bundle protein